MANRNQAAWDDIFGNIGVAVRAHLATKTWQLTATDNAEALAENARTRIDTEDSEEQAYRNAIEKAILGIGTKLTAAQAALKTALSDYFGKRLRTLLPATQVGTAVIDELILQMNEDSQTVNGSAATATHEARAANTGEVYLQADLLDASDQLTDWDLDGFGPLNTNAGTLYVELTYSSPTYSIDVFDDAAKTNRVAQGTTTTNNSTVTLTQDNSSGMTGSVGMVYTADDLDITISVPTLTGMARDGDKIDIQCTSIGVPQAEIWSVKSTKLGALGNATTGVAFTSVKAGIAFTLKVDNVAANYTKTNDASPEQISDFLLAGVNGTNTNSGRVYITISLISPNYTVQVYKATGRTTSDLVASGSRATTSGAVTLTAQNSSGLSGSCTINFTGLDNDIEVLVPLAALNDKYSLILTNDDAGRFLSVIRDYYDKELPSVTDGSETILDSLSQ